MQDPRIVNSRKQKSQRAMIPQLPENVYTRGPQEVSPPLLPMKTTLKASKKNSKKNGVPPFYRQQQERPKPSAQQMESSGVYNEYRALRRKFLLLEEESCNLGNELGEVEDEIKNLEDAKGELLDQLVVLEGLVDPSELQKQ